LWSRVISSRPGRRILIGLLSFVVTAILISVSVEFFGKKQPSNESAAISASAAKSESQEVASARAPAPASQAPLAPPPPNCQERDAQRLANGFLLGDEERTEGYGILKIVNGTDDDAVLNLVASDSGQTIRSVYVRNHNRVSIRRLTPGTYRAYFALGMDWDDAEGSFVCDSGYKEFGRSLVLQERTDANGTEYSELEITLHPVISGNVVSAPISKATFHSTLPHRHSQRNRSE